MAHSHSPKHAPGAPSTRSIPLRKVTYVNKREAKRVARLLRGELVGGVIIIVAAALGLIAANSPLADIYFDVKNFSFGPEAWHLHLSIGQWTADGLLAIFFFMVGLELKQEFVEGALSKVKTAIVPVAAAFGGVAVPALIFFAFNAANGTGHGWAVPTATDIAFAVAVLGLLAPGLPIALRMFLLTLAVVDDLIAIAIIAIFYTDGLQLVPLLISLVPIAVFGFITQKWPAWFARTPWAAWLILLPLGVVAWAFFHLSGIHATIAGVILAFLVPVHGSGGQALTARFVHRFQPLSSGVAVPLFAFFASGVAITGGASFITDPVSIGVIVGLVAGKPIGITLTTWLVTKLTSAELDPSVRWVKLIGVAALAGVGFTVAMLVTDLSFTDQTHADHARLGVMIGSVVAIGVAACILVRPSTRAADAASDID